MDHRDDLITVREYRPDGGAAALRGSHLAMTDDRDLVAWLRQQFDEDKRVALAAAAKCPAPWADRTDIDGEHPFVEDADGDRIMHHENSVPEIETTTHIARHDPERVLAEVAAKRAILELHVENTEWNGTSGPAICSTCVTFDTNDYYEAHREINFPCRTVLAMAQPYAGRSGWREEWAT